MDAALSHEWKVAIATTLLISFSVLAVILFLVILTIKITKARKHIRNTRFKNKTENILNELLVDYESFSESQIAEIRKELLELIVSFWQKEILIDLLIHYSINLTGEVEGFVKTLFYEHKLDKISLEYLKSGRDYNKVRAMRILSEMRHRPAWIEIIRFINHRRKLLRVEASLSLIFLTQNPLFFMDSLKFPLTRWQKINIYKRLLEFPLEEIPAFDRWYKSPNKTVRIFAAEMTAKFNQTQQKDKLAEILPQEDVEVQRQIVQTLTELEAFEYVEELATLLKNTDDLALISQLLYALGKLSMESEHTEIVAGYLTHDDFSIRMQAARAIQNMEDGEEKFAQLVELYPDRLSKIWNHLSNPLLR